MLIFRPYYLQKIKDILKKGEKKLIFLHGSRGVGKTTLLKTLQLDTDISVKKYYFSFEDDIVAKKFFNADDFRGYMQIKYGIDFHEPSLLLLNEIQYSKNIISVLDELIQDNTIKTTIIVTGIAQTQSEEYQNLQKSELTQTISIHPLSFFDFLYYRGIHTTYLTIDNPSPIMFRELQDLLEEYLTRWGYPEVIKATTKEKKIQHLRAILQKVYDKDVGFSFHREEILMFQEVVEYLCKRNMQGFKYKSAAEELDLSIPLLKKYILLLKDTYIIRTIPHFFTDKAKELSHQKMIAIEDMGLLSYMTENFGLKTNNITAIKNFVYNEIIKNLPENYKCFTYQKINNSAIDFIIRDAEGMLIPIVISESSSDKAPKVFKSFEERYGHQVRKYIKTTPLTAKKTEIFDKELAILPHFMISTEFWGFPYIQ